jgi:hypothetical protein
MSMAAPELGAAIGVLRTDQHPRTGSESTEFGITQKVTRIAFASNPALDRQLLIEIIRFFRRVVPVDQSDNGNQRLFSQTFF